ncbi:MAG TPA: ribonuclease HI family protein [Candidatus Paceibacterota bacterium]|nr:ribonuclease HI family protein [Candidatus Paceibacterota bacterium]
MPDYLIHADGGARGNPGPAAVGYTIAGPGISAVAHGEYIGDTTNNVAEYTAIIRALAKLKSLIGTDKAKAAHITVRADSELVVRQMNREYKVKDPDLMQLFIQLHNACLDFGAVNFTHVARESNREADRMVNEALDRHGAPKLGV